MAFLAGLIPSIIGAATSGAGKNKNKDTQVANNDNKLSGSLPSSGSNNNSYNLADAANLLPMYHRKTGDVTMTAKSLKDKLNNNEGSVMAAISGKGNPPGKTTTIIG